MNSNQQYTVVVPAAGIGQRMAADRPKQYLALNGITLLEHTLLNLHRHPAVGQIILVLHEQDKYFSKLAIAKQTWLKTVIGGAERCDSVLAGLIAVDNKQEWVLVHDAARPCLATSDLQKLIDICAEQNTGGILATRVRDTMKRSQPASTKAKHLSNIVLKTEDRDTLWHALTPQFFKRELLIAAITAAEKVGYKVTDEASAMEFAGHSVLLIEGSARNIKLTQAEDLPLVEFYLKQEQAQWG